MTAPRHHKCTADITGAALALARYSLLSIQTGLLIGILVMSSTCFASCAGYAEVIFCVVAGYAGATAAFVALVWQHFRLAKQPEKLAREAQWQWAWLGLSALVAMHLHRH